MEEPVTFDSAGCRLYGMLGRPPDGRAPTRAVILLHGWAGYRIGPHRMLLETARRLQEQGCLTLRFDTRGRGDSEGDGASACLDDMIEDLRAALRFLRAQAPVEHLTLLGLCSGSNVSIGAATLEPEVDELVLWSILPFQPEAKASQRWRRARFYLGEYLRKAARAETWKRLLKGEVNLKSAGRVVVGDAKPQEGGRNLKDSARDLMAAFGRYKGRALFITGDKDPEGLAGHELFSAFCRRKGLRADFHLIPGATHSYYSSAHKEQVIGLTLEWLGKTRYSPGP
jgi:pimeloyl-ACP methyl ester carboxylesterase